MTDSEEETSYIDLCFLLCLIIDDLYAIDYFPITEDFGEFSVSHDLDLGIGEEFLLHRFGCSELIGSHEHDDFGSEVSHMGRFFDSDIASSDDCDHLITKHRE